MLQYNGDGSNVNMIHNMQKGAIIILSWLMHSLQLQRGYKYYLHLIDTASPNILVVIITFEDVVWLTQNILYTKKSIIIL